jgi:molecular chaperone DnaJ
MKKAEAYNTLGLQEDASENDIKKAFRTLAAKNHPDTNKEDPKAEEKFKLINEAYQILSGKQKAEDDYNEMNFDGMNGVGNINDLFNELFNNGMNFNFNKRPSNIIPDLHIKVKLTFKESVFGCKKTFSYKIKSSCEECKGIGIKIYNNKVCNHCNGNGVLTSRTQVGMGMFRSFSVTCNKCKGTGKETQPCTKCKGAGFFSKKRTETLFIPPIGDTAVSFLIKKQGNERGGEKGDLVVNIVPEIIGKGEFEGMHISGRNVISNVNIPFNILLFGGKYKINTIHGEKETTINKMTNINDTIIIKNCGVLEHKDKKNNVLANKGHHIAKVQLKYPEKEKLTEELKKELEKIYK